MNGKEVPAEFWCPKCDKVSIFPLIPGTLTFCKICMEVCIVLKTLDTEPTET